MENNLLLTIESLYENLLKGMNLYFFSFTIVCTSLNQSSILVYVCDLNMREVEAEKLDVQDKLLLVSAIAAYMGPFLKADGEKRKKRINQNGLK